MKKVLIISVIALLVVIALFLITLGANSFGSESLAKNEIISERFDIDGSFSSIFISESSSDVKIAPTDGKPYLVITHRKCVEHSVEVKDGALTVFEKEDEKWYELPAFNFKQTKTVLYLPKGEYDTISLLTKSGSVSINGEFEFNEALLSVRSGKLNLEGQKISEISLESSSGDIVLNEITADSIRIETSSGTVCVASASASSIYASTSSGDIKLTSLEAQSCVLKTSSGDTKINSLTASSVSHITSSGNFDAYDIISETDIAVTTSSGDVELKSSDSPAITVNTSSGDVFITLLTKKTYEVKTSSGSIKLPKENDGDKDDNEGNEAEGEILGFCRVTSSSGDVKISVK